MSVAMRVFLRYVCDAQVVSHGGGCHLRCVDLFRKRTQIDGGYSVEKTYAGSDQLSASQALNPVPALLILSERKALA